MIARDCGSFRRQLSAFHDGELGVDDQIAVQAHLRECPACAAEVEEMDVLGSCLRAGSLANRTDDGEWENLPSLVVSRMRAEEAESFRGWAGRLFDDLHLVWAALGATGATVTCLAVVFTIFYFAVLPQAGSDRNPVSMDSAMSLPSAYSSALPPAVAVDNDEVLFALAAVLTRDGKLANATLLSSSLENGSETAAERQEVLEMVEALSKARFEPARYAGSPAPVAVNMVWLYASLTVRAKSPGLQLTPRQPSRSPISTPERRRRTNVLSA